MWYYIRSLKEYQCCLLIHGLPKSKNDNADELLFDTVKEKMGEEIEKDEIDRLHRLGAPKNNGKSRPIIIKFVRYNTRCRILKNNTREDHGFENVVM